MRVSLTAGQQKILKFSMNRISRIFVAFNVVIVLLMHLSWFFRVKYIVRRIIEARKSGTPCFLCLSLLLSTTILNDIVSGKIQG